MFLIVLEVILLFLGVVLMVLELVLVYGVMLIRPTQQRTGERSASPYKDLIRSL